MEDEEKGGGDLSPTPKRPRTSFVPVKQEQQELSSSTSEFLQAKAKGKEKIKEEIKEEEEEEEASSLEGEGKGKEKITEEEIKDEEEEEEGGEEEANMIVCGICLIEEGKAIRGWIDSCNHFFCFVCITEWSKIESRCPMCKRRFTTIRRPPKQLHDGCSLRHRTLKVPLRDQVWHPDGNQTNEQSDPFAEVNCMECQGSADENLLLLCDLCNSAAHTYCVGLGHTVPEGDWYCHDCTISRNDHTDSQLDTDYCDEDSSNAAGIRVSISEIVQEPYFQENHRVPGEISGNPDQQSSSVSGDVPATTTVTDSSARTLRRCRNVHSHIRALRENWDALRNGSLSFSSDIPNSVGIGSKKRNSREVISNESRKLQSSFSNSSQSTTRENVSGDRFKDNLYDIDRAWKMMDIATSVQQAQARKFTQKKFRTSDLAGRQRVPKEASQVMQNGNHLLGKQLVRKEPSQRVEKETLDASSSFPISKSNLFLRQELGRVVPENVENTSTRIAHQRKQPQKSSEQKLSRDAALKENLEYCRRPSVSHPSFRPSQNQLNLCNENSVDMHKSSNFSVCGGNIASIALIDSQPRDSDLSDSRRASGASFGCIAELPVEENGKEKSSSKLTVKKDEDAKLEIQSLVKLNLKLLSRDKHLGVDRFKEVARLATHTILAACGLEHKKSSVRRFPDDSVCRHKAKSKRLVMSNLMRSSCRECFYVFVKEVVSSIMVEEIAVGS